MEKQPNEDEITITPDHASGGDSGSTLLPMLIGGLILILIGAAIVMFFY